MAARERRYTGESEAKEVTVPEILSGFVALTFGFIGTMRAIAGTSGQQSV